MTCTQRLLTFITALTLFTLVFITFGLVDKLNTNSPILLYFSSEKNELLSEINDLESSIENHEIDIEDSIFNKEGFYLRNKEWEQLSHYAFFKRATAHYFIDKNLLKIFFVGKKMTDTFKYKLESIIRIRDDASNFTITLNGTVDAHGDVSPYEIFTLNHRFNIFDFITSKDDIESVKMNVIVRDAQSTNYTTKYPMKVKIKYAYQQANQPKKNGTAVCSKCYYYTNNEAHKHFEWWFELNKKVGNNKVVICNSSIPNTDEYNRVFYKYNDIVYINQMETLPNFLSQQDNNVDPEYSIEHNYLSSFLDLKRDGQFDIWLTNIFDIITFNECYLDNVDKFEYITIMDNDEIILPRALDKFKTISESFNHIKSFDLEKCDKRECVDSVLAELSSCKISQTEFRSYALSLKKPDQKSNLHFKMGFYLKDGILNKIFAKFNEYFGSEIYRASNQTEHVIRVADLDPPSKQHKPYNYTFILTNKEEISYAKNLVKIYNLYLSDYKNSNIKDLEQYSSHYERFMLLAGKSTDFAWGKTAHNTDKTLMMHHHYPLDADVHQISFDDGYLSHFRESYTFADIQIPISELVFDMNYFYCYFLPIFESLKNKN